MPARPRSRPRQAFVVTTAAASLALACGGSIEEGGPGSSGGTGGTGTVNPPDPCWEVTAASEGAGCAAPGAVCLVPQCSAPLWLPDLAFSCLEGRWTSAPAASCNPPPPACPAAMPAQGAACALSEGASCSYGGNACCPPETALCQGGVWEILYISCNPPPPECPVAIPATGASCAPSDPCGMTSRMCSYSTPTCLVSATCDAATITWQVVGCAADAGAGG